MRSGVPGFVSAKLTEARIARGISSRKALADMLQRAASTVIRWEEGDTSPEAPALAELAQALAVPQDFFVTPREPNTALSFFRSLTGALRTDRNRQQVRLTWLEDLAAVAEHYAFLPAIDIPDLLSGAHFRSLRAEDIEALAEAARDHWSLGLRPIPNMIVFLEQIGAVVASETMETDQLDGLSTWGRDGRPYVLLANDKQSFARRQFDAAHELAHLLIHRTVTRDEFEANFKLIEDQAHRFASAFLLPARQFSVEIDIPSMWELERLKSRWKVSMKAMIMRAQRLNLVDQASAVRLYKVYSAKGYASKGEPFDNVWPLQEPTLLADVFKALIDSGQLTKEALRDDLPLLPHDVEGLAGLPQGWLSQETGRIIELRPPAGRRRGDTKNVGQVVEFPRKAD